MFLHSSQMCTELILGLCPANERRSYKVMAFLIGWAQILNQPPVYEEIEMAFVEFQVPFHIFLNFTIS